MFTPRTIELTGGFPVDAVPVVAFELFSPLGERRWVPGWDPELLHPPGVAWASGMLFRTQEERGEAIWVVTRLDRQRHEVEYHRVEAGRYVARVNVRCRDHGEGGTTVDVGYTFVGLSETGNQDIAAMTTDAYAAKMQRWQAWIARHLAAGVT